MLKISKENLKKSAIFNVNFSLKDVLQYVLGHVVVQW
jgi:hypothetical protein